MKFEIWKTNNGYTIYAQNEKGHFYQLSHLLKDEINDNFKSKEEAEQKAKELSQKYK